jgi:hypothetical protein
VATKNKVIKAWAVVNHKGKIYGYGETREKQLAIFKRRPTGAKRQHDETAVRVKIIL